MTAQNGLDPTDGELSRGEPQGHGEGARGCLNRPPHRPEDPSGATHTLRAALLFENWWLHSARAGSAG